MNKNLFQVHRCALIFPWVSTVAFKFITLLSWDSQNQFCVGYWAISYYKYCKLIESWLWREISKYSLLSIAAFIINYFTKMLLRENNKKTNKVKLLDKGLIIIIAVVHKLSIKYYSLILLENLRNSCHCCC